MGQCMLQSVDQPASSSNSSSHAYFLTCTRTCDTPSSTQPDRASQRRGRRNLIWFWFCFRFSFFSRVTQRSLEPYSAHGLHLTTWGVDDEGAAASAWGGHYNPQRLPHALPSPVSNARHLGDMGVVTADAAGSVAADLLFDFSSPAFSGVHGLRGRGVVLQQDADSGEQPEGAGSGSGSGSVRTSSRPLCAGVLGLSNRAMPPQPPVYSSFCDRYSGLLGMNHSYFVESALIRAIYGVDSVKTGMRFPDGYGPPALHEVPGCLGEGSPVRGWFNGDIGYRTRASPPALAPPAPDYSDRARPASLRMVRHMTQYFALLLGCSTYSSGDYQGVQNMHVVHGGMMLQQGAFDFFARQLRISFTSFGCAEEDVAAALAPVLAGFLRSGSGSVAGSGGNRDDYDESRSSNAICTEMDCRCAPNLCGTDCTPQACRPQRVNGSLPVYPTGYAQSKPATSFSGAHSGAQSAALLLLLSASLLGFFLCDL